MQTRSDLKAVLDAAFEIDPLIPQKQLEFFAASMEVTRRRTMIEVFQEHMFQEMIELDIAKLMATMVAEPELHYYGMSSSPDVGFDAVRTHYLKSFPSRSNGGVSVDIERLVVDDEALYFEGRGLYSLDFVRENFDLDLTPNQPAIVVKKLGVLVAYADDKIVYEAQYFDGDIATDDVVLLT